MSAAAGSSKPCGIRKATSVRPVEGLQGESGLPALAGDVSTTAGTILARVPSVLLQATLSQQELSAVPRAWSLSCAEAACRSLKTRPRTQLRFGLRLSGGVQAAPWPRCIRRPAAAVMGARAWLSIHAYRSLAMAPAAVDCTYMYPPTYIKFLVLG